MTLSDFCAIICEEACFKSLGRPATYCSDFISIVAAYVHVLDLKKCIYANDIISAMEKGKNRWMEVDAIAAQKAANLGALAIAGWASGRTGPGGHVCVVVEGAVIDSQLHKTKMPIVCNIGQNNWYGKHAGFAFKKDHPPRYWICAIPNIRRSSALKSS